jgi:hypothetical protein
MAMAKPPPVFRQATRLTVATLTMASAGSTVTG